MIPTMKEIQEDRNRILSWRDDDLLVSRTVSSRKTKVRAMIDALNRSIFASDFDMCKEIIAKLPPSMVKRHTPYYYPMYQELRRRVDQRNRNKYKRRITNKLISLVQQRRADEAVELVLDNRYDLEPVIVQSVLALKGEQA